MPTKLYTCTGCGRTATLPFEPQFNYCDCPKKETNISLPLTQYCSKYYALSYLALEKPLEFAPKFQEFSATLAQEFFDYTVRATGGEVRNFSFNEETRAVLESLPTDISEFIIDHQSCLRKHMYTDWVALKSKFTEIELLGFAQKMFNEGKWRQGFGGESWGKICDLAIQFAKKEITPVIFVDTCWGLHHNGNVFLDKEYRIPVDLTDLLDAGRAEKMSVVYKYLSDESLKSELSKILDLPEPKIEIHEAPWEIGSTIWFPYKNLKNPKSSQISSICPSYVYVKIPYTRHGVKSFTSYSVPLKDIISEKPIKGKIPEPYKFISSEPVNTSKQKTEELDGSNVASCLPDPVVKVSNNKFAFSNVLPNFQVPDNGFVLEATYKINLDTLEETKLPC